jgi:putative tryptophan/tyrosine transport system substrate-binding protein
MNTMPKIGIIHSGRGGGHVHDTRIKGFKDATILTYNGADGALNFMAVQWGDDNPANLDPIATNLAQDNTVSLIAATGGSASANAAKKATQRYAPNKPIVFTSVGTPNRPAANMTGICARTSLLDPDRLRLLYQLKLADRAFGALVNPDRPNINDVKDALNAAAGLAGYPNPNFQDARFGTAVADITSAYQYWHTNGYAAVLVTADPLFHDRHTDLIPIANDAAIGLPTIYQWRNMVEDGGLMSYGPNLDTCYRLAGYFAGRILNHQNPSTLPILTPACELVINLQTAKTINCDIPMQVLNQATYVIA